MDLFDYVIKYNNLTFKEKPFNDVEAAIFILLSYGKFEDIIPDVTLKQEGIKLENITEEQINIVSTPKTFGPENNKIINLMKDSPRYKDIIIENSMSIIDNEALEQFSALTFNIPYVGLLITFRGTDGSYIGWKENFSILYNGATLSQLDAKEYLYQITSIHPNENFMVAGHSKGGNLAMYSLFYLKKEVKEKLIKAYSFDGFGFKTKDYRNIYDYDECVEKLVQIVPKDSFVGELFYTPFNINVISAWGKGLIQHHPLHWEIDDEGNFVQVKKRGFKSRVFHRTIKRWSQFSTKHNYEIFVRVITTALQADDGHFGKNKDDEKILKKILKSRKILTFKERTKFNRLTLALIGIFIQSLLYYAIKPICLIFKKNK